MADKSQTFLVTIAILEGRHYVWMNMDSAVIVKVDNKKRCTSVRYNSDGPYYNEYFVFEFFTTYEKMVSKNITITVIVPRSISRRRKILGYFTLDIATVWAQKNHQFYHKWAILSTSKSDMFSGPRGYIKVDISILSKGEIAKMPVHIINDEIEGNLLLPEGSYNERLRATYIFDVFRCENLAEKPSTTVSDTELINATKQSGPTTYVEISFAGLKVRTSVRKNTCFPVFNERLKIIDLFPPLCQRIKIDIRHGEYFKKHIYKYINVKLISSDKEEGFLPTFGPTFLHIYFSNTLEGYAGSIIISMHTELHDLVPTDTKKSAVIESILPLNEQQYFQYEEVLLFATIFEASAIHKRYCDKSISFRITFGGVLVQKYLATSGESPLINATVAQKPMKTSKQFCSMSFASEKPMLIIDTKLPFFKRRIYSVNILSKIARALKEKIDKIEDMFQRQLHRTAPKDIDEMFIQSFDYISGAGRKYLDIISEYNLDLSTDLDKERRCMCIKEMTNILDKIDTVYNQKSRKKTFEKLQNIYAKIEALIIDIQDCWPDVFLWMVCGNKKVACFQIPARDIAYSPVEDEMGYMCGIKTPVCLYSSQKDPSNVSCRMEVMFWLGLDKHKNNYIKCIPQGFKLQNDALLLARKLIAEEAYLFQLRAYLFQGKISPGFDKSGLADTFVRVLAGNQQKETHVIKVSLSPVWNEMLIFNNIVQCGSKAYIRRNALMVVLEVFDKDRCGKTDLIGRCSVKPAIKFVEEPYSSPDFPPRLHWHKLFNNSENLGEILAAFELLEISDKIVETEQQGTEVISIPQEIRPTLISYRIDVLFWGVRDLRKINYIQINRPRISIICGEDVLVSDTIENAKRNSNFPNQRKSLDVAIPSQREYVPPLCMKLYDSRRFGVYTYAGVHISSISQFLFHPMTADERMKCLSGGAFMTFENVGSGGSKVCPQKDCPKIVQLDKTKSVKSRSSTKNVDKTPWLVRWIKNVCRSTKGNLKGKSGSSLGTYERLPQDDPDSDDFDWWTKFYDSLETYRSGSSGKSAGTERPKLRIYRTELERQPEFNGFTDMFTTFEMYKGKRTGDETVDEENITALFKGAVKIYAWPLETNTDYVTPSGSHLTDGVFHDFPENQPLRYLLRVYCIRAVGLRPKDPNGKSDPYLWLTLGDKSVRDRENVLVRQVDPVFGRFFEFSATFPNDHTLTIAIWDHDSVSSDDLIGDTKIDLENRFYSKHRALCGISENYNESGYCEWRDYHRPSIILQELCKKWNVAAPEYTETSVSIGFKEFVPTHSIASGDANYIKEVIALAALRRWQEVPVVGCQLVPEHVETRSLYNSSKPGIEQGKLQIWIDMFPVGDLPPPSRVNICPRKPTTYELRVIIWNTDDVQLNEDDFFLGEKKSDIFVKGWVIDISDAQYTDVHYRSLTGEGNFNWRFIFRFDYLSTENKIVIRKKDSIFASEPTEHKIPCKLKLQVWDNDTLSRDDFIGSLTLELSKMPRGARVSEKCHLSLLEPQAPTINLFKIRRTKGWWPFAMINSNSHIQVLTGKVEAELEILTAEEADKSPAGLGRREPQGLPAPNRPDVSFSWFKNPLKALNYVFCKLHRCKILTTCLMILLVFAVLAAIYAIPGYTVKRLLGAR